ncbi:MAG: hypothetical protein U0457_20775 [Candidatus Sericytochromatia bacterium]
MKNIFTIIIIIGLFIKVSDALELKAGNFYDPKDISEFNEPIFKKGLKWTYVVKSNLANFEIFNEIIDIKNDILTIKYSTKSKKIKIKKISKKDFSFIPKTKKNNQEVPIISDKIKYENNELLIVNNKSYNTQKFSGDIDMPMGKGKSLIWFSKSLGIVKIESNSTFLKIPLKASYELKSFFSP